MVRAQYSTADRGGNGPEKTDVLWGSTLLKNEEGCSSENDASGDVSINTLKPIANNTRKQLFRLRVVSSSRRLHMDGVVFSVLTRSR